MFAFRGILERIAGLVGALQGKSVWPMTLPSQLQSGNQIQQMITLKKIICAFARSTRRTARTNLPVAEEDNLHQEELIEQEFQDDIEPLSYDKQVQESIKEKIAQELKFNYEGQDPNPHKLVHRPSKGAAWGLGGQLMLASRKVQLEGLKPETDDITQFLQLHQVKNIYIHDFFAENPDRPDTNRKRYAILGSCFSSKHCWKVAIQLKNAFNLNSAKTKLKRRQTYDPIFAVMNGGKDEQWCMVDYKDYEVSLMTEQQREAMDLEWKWNNPASDEVMEKHVEMKLRKGRKNQFEDL